MNKIVLKKRIGYFISEDFGKYHKTSWPLGKLIITKSKLNISSLISNFELDISEIDQIDKHFLGFGIEIIHHSSNILKNVSLHGLFLFNAIEKAVKSNFLNINLID